MGAMERPRVFLMPTLCEVEWSIRPRIEEWADVASFDAPGVGDSPDEQLGFSADAVIERGLTELDRLGWDDYVLVGDEFGAAQAVRLARRRPEGIRGIALGHASLSLSDEGPDAPINAEVTEAVVRIARTDYRSFVRALTQVTKNAYDDELAERYMERVPPRAVAAYIPEVLGGVAREDLEPTLRSLDVPMLLVEHRGCLMWSQAGFEAAVAAFPEATSASLEVKPSANPEFAELLRDFCASLPPSGGSTRTRRRG
jgi:pimeloyl-ACP methyl ester carboxylesterase